MSSGPAGFVTLVSSEPKPTHCRGCSQPIAQKATGRPREWCTAACKQRGYRRRARRG